MQICQIYKMKNNKIYIYFKLQYNQEDIEQLNNLDIQDIIKEMIQKNRNINKRLQQNKKEF